MKLVAGMCPDIVPGTLVFPANSVWWNTYEKDALSHAKLVMGKGFAKRVRDCYPGVDVWLGDLIAQMCVSGGFYGYTECMQGRIGALQTKTWYQNPSSLALLQRSLGVFKERIESHRLYSMPMPGVGLGGLDFDRVLALLHDTLPDNVTVYSGWPRS